MRYPRMILFVSAIALAAISASARADAAGKQNESHGAVHSPRPYLVSISVADLDATIRWYRDNLGFVVKKKMELPKYALRIAFAELDGFQLELIEFRRSVSYEAIQKLFPFVDDRGKVQGFGKLAFLVEDIEAAAKELKKKGVTFVRDVTDDKEFAERMFMVTDNSGNTIQFIQKMK